MKPAQMSKIIEQSQFAADVIEAIIEHPRHGRLYLAQRRNFEGDTFALWSNGLACKVLPGDTLESLHEYDHDYPGCADTVDRMTHGYDDARPLQNWGGNTVEKLALAAGLPY